MVDVPDGIPLVSVVVSTYAAERLLGRCLDGLMNQSIADRLEVIVIDSGSPEDERSIVERFLESGRLRYVRTERESLYSAWNRGLDIASGTYFANVNTDDWIAPNALEILAAALEEHTDCALAYSDWALTHTPATPPRADDRICRHSEWHPALHFFYCYSGCVQFWRRSSLAELGGFDDRMEAAGDLAALRRLADAGMTPVYVPEVLAAYYQNPKGISQADDTSSREQVEIFSSARRETGIESIYAVDLADPRSVADAWTALGVLAMRLRVPWHEESLKSIGFAAECFRTALEIEPLHLDALHNLYALSYEFEGQEAAERHLEGVPTEIRIAARGADLDLRAQPVQLVRRGAVFVPR